MATFDERLTEQHGKADKLLATIKKRLPMLKKVYKETSGVYYEDGIYRFYHGSFKAYFIQDYTKAIVDELIAVSPDGEIKNEDFKRILKEGTKEWKHSRNYNWHKEVRPILEAYFHARYFLEMMIRYGKKYNKAPEIMDYGWAAVLYLYELR